MKEHNIDVTGVSFGRAASEVAKILMGKNKTDFAYNKVTDDIVIVENIEKLKIVESKLSNPYYRHSGYIGNLKKKSLGEISSNDMGAFFTSVVSKMLPDNRLRKARLKRLKIK